MRTARRTAATPGRPLLAVVLAAGAALASLSPVAASSPATVQVVVTSSSAGVDAVADAVRAAGGVVRDALPLARGVSAELPAGAVLAPGFSVVRNAPLTLASADVGSYEPAVTPVREALGLAGASGGAGVRIAVVDTGVADSPEFASRLEHHPVVPVPRGQSADPYGHGTFVAGVAAGGGVADPRYAGVAPHATVLDVRVADAEGATDLITVLRGLHEAARQGADVVNLSLSSGSTLPYQIDPLTVALEGLWASGVVVVVPTGNDGPARGSITAPGWDPVLLTVGALDGKRTPAREDDDVPAFSGRGPAPQEVAKPDVVAPGQSLVSVRAPGSRVDAQNPQARVGGSYFRGSGTSFATAAVAGTSALLLEQRGRLSPDQVKALLRETAYTTTGLAHVDDAGAGGVSVAAALAAPAPQVDAPVVDAPPPGDEHAWRALGRAVRDGDPAAAANSWSLLSPAAHKWGAHKWDAHKWGANSWSAHTWAAHKWAAHKWAANSWSAHTWAASSWSAHAWAGADWR